MTKPENFLKFSSLLNFVLSSMTRSQVFVWVGPACMTASMTLHTLVFMRPKLVITSSFRPSSRMVWSAGQNSWRRMHLMEALLE